MQQFIELYFAKGSYVVQPMQGDAGQRSYYRITANNKSYIIMDCPDSNVQPFIDVAIYLRNQGFSAPEIIRQDVGQGFLILEDFGDLNVTNYLLSDACKDKSKREDIYYLIIDLLISLQEKELPTGLREFDNNLLLSELSLFTDYYIPYKYKRKLQEDELEEFKMIWRNILSEQLPMAHSIILRDYHVDNIMYLEQRTSLEKLGIIDFQDALIGSPVYDLVSVLEDARIEVSRAEAMKYLEYFAGKKNLDKDKVFFNYHILGAQRNSRILGVFARKLIRDNDDNYLQYIPRVLRYLEYDMSHATLAPLQKWLENLE